MLYMNYKFPRRAERATATVNFSDDAPQSFNTGRDVVLDTSGQVMCLFTWAITGGSMNRKSITIRNYNHRKKIPLDEVVLAALPDESRGRVRVCIFHEGLQLPIIEFKPYFSGSYDLLKNYEWEKILAEEVCRRWNSFNGKESPG